jgi:hypothetical protein
MAKPIKKTRLILGGNKHLGDLLVVPLHHGGFSLKLSFKNKIGYLNTWGRHHGPPEALDPKDALSQKSVKDGESLDVSYNFKTRALEVKQEGSGPNSGTERRFYSVIHPIDRQLFTLYVRDKSALSEVKPAPEDFILHNDKLGEMMAIAFSFVGDNGKAFMDPNITSFKNGRQFRFDLEGLEHDKLMIAVLPYNQASTMTNHFTIAIPHQETKRTK